MSDTSVVVTFAWTSLIVLSELLAFYLIQKNVDEEAGLLSSGVIISCLLFGVVVTIAFRQLLMGGTNIPLANLYWIIGSQIGAVIVAYYFFDHSIYLKDWIAMTLLLVSLIVSYAG